MQYKQDTYSQFYRDLQIAQFTEKMVTDKLIQFFEKHSYKILSCEFNNDFRYDVIFRIKSNNTGKNAITKTLKIEIKEDFMCAETGNVIVEFECRGKPSGISTTQSHLYIYVIHMPNGTLSYRMLKTASLKKMIIDKKYFRIVYGGGDGNSTNYLFKLETFLKESVNIF